MPSKRIPSVEPRRGAAARFVGALLRRGEATGREILAGLRAAGLSLSVGRLRDLMGNLMDSGLVRVRAAAGGPGCLGRPRVYRLVARRRRGPEGGRSGHR